MIRKIKSEDKRLYIEFGEKFYKSDAVLHDVPCQYRINTFDEMMRSSEYVEGYILEADHRAVGYGVIAKTFSQECGGKVLWLEELYIEPEYRSRGLGKEYFKYMEEKAHRENFKRIRFEVEEDNVRAIKLYRACGYKFLEYRQMIKEF